MAFNFSRLEIPEVILVEPTIFSDSRGYFLEQYRENQFATGGIQTKFVQDNLSRSVRGTLRGLHSQIKRPQAKLVTCLRGEIFDVAVDLRPDSPSFGKWVAAILSGETKRQLFIPEGFAHGFCVTSDVAEVYYKCSSYYSPEDECGVLWSDPDIGIQWPISDPLLSEKDKKNLQLREVKAMWESRS
ncbi:MAG: dTDP-4-dehydrorhamnose 3,5-epimerase [bacterium]